MSLLSFVFYFLSVFSFCCCIFACLSVFLTQLKRLALTQIYPIQHFEFHCYAKNVCVYLHAKEKKIVYKIWNVNKPSNFTFSGCLKAIFIKLKIILSLDWCERRLRIRRCAMSLWHFFIRHYVYWNWETKC